MEDFLLEFFEENRDHFLAICEPFLPVLVVEIYLDVFLLAIFVFFDNELLEGILKNSAVDPFFEYLKVRL